MTPQQAKSRVARFGFEPRLRVAYRGGFLRDIGDYSHPVGFVVLEQARRMAAPRGHSVGRRARNPPL
jgi:hypothetical protein